jgi:hypothetical protein
MLEAHAVDHHLYKEGLLIAAYQLVFASERDVCVDSPEPSRRPLLLEVHCHESQSSAKSFGNDDHRQVLPVFLQTRAAGSGIAEDSQHPWRGPVDVLHR